MWSGILSREKFNVAEAEAVESVEGNMLCTAMQGVTALPWSETPLRMKGRRRNLGDLAWPAVALAIPGRDGKARSQSRRGAGEESDGLVVPLKRSNKPVMNGSGGRGGKGPGRREGGRQCMLRTLCRASHVTGVVRLRIGAARAAQLGMPITSDLRQEPGAGKPHAGICAGGGEQSSSLPRQEAWPCEAHLPATGAERRSATLRPPAMRSRSGATNGRAATGASMGGNIALFSRPAISRPMPRDMALPPPSVNGFQNPRKSGCVKKDGTFFA